MSIIDEIIMKNRAAYSALSMTDIKDWSVWTQDGPSDETMLVSKALGIGVLYDKFLGYSSFPLPLSCLEKCGWVCVGEL